MNIMDMTVRDLFNLADNQIRKIDYMTDSYEEVDSSLDEIPDKTLDDIMDEIKRENEEPVVDDDPEPTDDPEPEPEPTPEPEPDPDPDPEPEPEPEEPGPMDPYIDKCNVLITEINAERNNAIIANIMDHKVTEDDPTVISICSRVFHILGDLYSITNSVRSIFISDANTNKRALFMVDAYNALVDLTTLVNAIYNALNAKAYLVQVNGPVEADLEHWNTEEVQNNLASLDVWIATDDNTKLSLIDEGIQFDLKYAALLKKLVICEFKGFDEYYDNLIKILCQMHKAMDNFTPEYNEMDPNESIFYDPTILGKASAISMLVRGYIPFEPDPEPDPGE